MKKNYADQTVAFQMVSSTTFADVTSGTPTVYVTLDGGTQSTGSGVIAHEGNGCWSYTPTQAETNGDHCAYTMVLATAVTQTVNVYTVIIPSASERDLIDESRTFFMDGRRSRSIVELNSWSTGTRALAIDMSAVINPDTTLSSVDAVTVTNTDDLSTTTVSGLVLQRSRMKATFSIDAIAAASEHTVSVDVTASDGEEFKNNTGTLRVY